MRKVIVVMLSSVLMVFFSYQSVLAEESVPVLEQANIEITVSDNVYTVRQDIVLSNYKGESVVHNKKEITKNKVTNVQFLNGEEELVPVIDSGETLHKYTIEPTNSSTNSDGNMSYTIEYNVEKQEKEFEVPLFVPEYASSGDDRVITITFQAPEGTKIQKNSFPNVIESNQSFVEKEMANIPAMAKYVFSENPTSIHSFSVISFIAIFSIFALLFGWARVELKRGGSK